MKQGARIALGIGSIMVVAATFVVAGPAAASAQHVAAASGVSEAFSSAASVQHSADVWAFGATFTASGGKIVLEHRHQGHWTRRLIAEPTDGSRVTGIVAASTSTVWLWGTNPGGGGAIWRLAGQQLKTVSVPSVVGKDEYGTQAVVGSSLANVWVVGVDASGVKPLAVHWNGKGWKNTAVPAGSGSYTEVRNIATSSATNAVAYGQSDTGLPVWIWNGKKWRAASPGKLARPTYAVATSGPTQSYLIGTTTGEISNPTSPQALYVLKWNGKKWSKTSAPSTHPVTVLSAVAVGTSAFVVGYRSVGGVQLPIIARFTKGKWRYQKTPKLVGIGTQLRAVVGTSPKAVLAVGQNSTKTADPGEPDYHLLAETFNGHAWKLVKALPG
jgi:hypothetical protein